MEQFKIETLVSSLESGLVTRALLTYHINLYSFITDKSSPPDQTAQSFILQQLESQIDYLQDDKNKEKLEKVSQPLRVAIAKNYATILGINKNKLFDTTNRFVTIFADISKKKSHNTALKHLSVVILSFIYESFGHELLSFVVLLNSTILKYLKKNQESKVIVSNYSLNLSKLLAVILRNGGHSELDESLQNKFYKFFKSTLHDTNSSVQLSANLFESWGFISAIKKQDQSLYQITNNSLILSGLGSSQKVIRIAGAKALAESFKVSQLKLKDVFKIYNELYIEGNLFAKAGIIESSIQYFNISTAADYDYIVNNFDEILQSVLSIFDHERVQSDSKNSLARITNYIDYFFEKLLKFTGESSQRQIFDKLFKYYLSVEDRLSTLKLIPVLNLVKRTLKGISTLSECDIELYQITLMKLAASPNYEIRVHTVTIIKILATGFPHVINDLLETSFNELANNYQQSSEKRLNYTKSHGLALILANLVSLADKDYVPFELIINIWDLVTSNLRTKGANVQDSVTYYRILTSWTVLTGLFNYQDAEYLKSKETEFLTLWENLDPIKPDAALPDDLIKILEIESHSFTALLNFLHNIEITEKIAYEFSGFLSKRRIILSTIIPESKEVENLLLLINKRILDIHLKLVNPIGSDINSLLLIQTIKNFANLPNYDVAKNEKLDLWQIDDGFSNGLTSKYNGFNIDDLAIKYNKDIETQGNSNKSDYSIDTFALPKGSIESTQVKSWLSPSTWIDEFELKTLQPVSTSLMNDPFIPLFGNSRYSLGKQNPVPLATAVVDSSIELFSLTFPFLSTKVQLSLLENLRTFVLSKSINDTTKLAISINSSIALRGALSIAQSKSLNFEQSVGTSVLEILRTLYEFNPSPYLLNMNSDSIGIIVSRTSLAEQIPIFIKKIVEEQQSVSRAFSSLILAAIYRYNSSHFNQIWEILIKLVLDPHPTVHSWTLDALSTLIGKHVSMNLTKAKELIGLLYNFYLDDNYGAFSDSTAASNLNVDIDSNRVLSKLLRHIVTSLGPGVKDLDSASQNSLNNLIHALFFLHNDEVINSEVTKLIQELIIYDSQAISKQTLIDLIEFNISNNLWNVIGSSLTLPIFGDCGEVFPVTSSFKVLGVSLDLLYQIVKTNDDKQFLSQVEHLIWITLELFPESPLINKLTTEWLDSTYDLAWFIKLHDLFNISKRKLYEKLFTKFRAILSKYVQKKVEVDVNDEEAQSIAKKAEGEDEENKNNETVNWKFKSVLVVKIRRLLEYTQRDTKLYDQLASKVSDLIKISFSSSTSTITELRYLGIELLGDVISIYASAKDPIYPTMSLLEQRQAQITSALTPAFHYDSTPFITSKAINVVATFVGSKVVKINRLGRILKILTESLEDIHDSEDFKLQDVHITSARGQKRVKLAVLNAWAELKILAFANQDEDLNALVEKNLESLIPLWAATLKEYTIIKHGPQNNLHNQDAELYEECWVNLVDVIGCIVETEEDKIDRLFNKDCFGFFYMLYSQVIYSIIGNDDNKVKKLSALSKVLSYKKLVELILHDDIFDESIEVFERLILTGSIEEQTEVLNITSKIFLNFFDTNFTNHELEEHVDKLFELVRVNIQTILRLVPYLEQDNKRTVSNVEQLSYEEQLLLKKSFGIINKMLSRFPDMIKVDLYSSLLSLVISVYQEEENFTLKNQVIPSILPILKSLLQELVDMNDIVTVNNFYQTIKPNLKVKHDMTSDRNLLLTIGVLLSTSNDVLRLNNKDVEFIASNLATGLIDDNIIAISTQSIKSLIAKKSNLNSVILKKLWPKILSNILEGSAVDPRVSIELIILAIKQVGSDEKQIAMYTILIPTLIFINQKIPDYGSYLHKKLISLVQLNPQVFKIVVNEVLTQEQRIETEKLVKFDGKAEDPPATEHEQIQLKTFGDV